MKKLFLMLSATLLLCSCSENKEIENKETIKPTVKNFTHEGHNYLWFEMGMGRSRTSGVVHDPDCDCYYNNCDSLYYDLWY